MKSVPFGSRVFQPAGHENPLSPGVVKKVLVDKQHLQPGRVQMINWANLGVGKAFARHYHEDMQEVFVIVHGEARLTVGQETVILRRGDAVVIEAGETHQMQNLGTEPVEYLAIGISRETGGRTVVVE